MPFGLANAPREFQRFIYHIFQPLIRQNKILPYLDDLLIATETLEEHLAILSEVFQIAHTNSLNFRLDKCKFMYEEIDYLGYLIDFRGIQPSPSNVENIVDYPIPRDAKEVHRFLGIASYFRRFVPNFSLIAKPLYDLTRKDVPFVFSVKEVETFEELKQHLSSEPLLAIYSPLLPTELHCDASSARFEAMLIQKQTDGTFKPIAYFSERTSPEESRYHSFELECLSAIYAIKRFHIYLYGIPFKIVTDYDSFRLTLSKKNVNPRIARWALFLQSYNYDIVHRPGKRKAHVDALSRCYLILILEENTLDQNLAIAQSSDEIIKSLRDKLEKQDDKLFELRDGFV